jgi:hypothetical protein
LIIRGYFVSNRSRDVRSSHSCLCYSMFKNVAVSHASNPCWRLYEFGRKPEPANIPVPQFALFLARALHRACIYIPLLTRIDPTLKSGPPNGRHCTAAYGIAVPHLGCIYVHGVLSPLLSHLDLALGSWVVCQYRLSGSLARSSLHGHSPDEMSDEVWAPVNRVHPQLPSSHIRLDSHHSLVQSRHVAPVHCRSWRVLFSVSVYAALASTRFTNIDVIVLNSIS